VLSVLNDPLLSLGRIRHRKKHLIFQSTYGISPIFVRTKRRKKSPDQKKKVKRKVVKRKVNLRTIKQKLKRKRKQRYQNNIIIITQCVIDGLLFPIPIALKYGFVHQSNWYVSINTIELLSYAHADYMLGW
jgi:hypothetical protein